MDDASKTLSKVLETLEMYALLLETNKVNPMPDGAIVWGHAVKYLHDHGVKSLFLEQMKDPELNSADSSDVKVQVHAPDDADFVAAVAALCSQGARRLHYYPGWRNKFLQHMLKEFGASTDQVLELSQLQETFNETKDEMESTWNMMDDKSTASSTAKAAPKPIGYRS